jgi:hypothetical protein
MPTAGEIAVILKAKDEMSGALKSASAQTRQFGTDADAGSKSTANFGQMLGKLAVAGAALAGVVKLAKGVASLVQESAAVPGIARSFENLGGSIEAMRAGTAGMVSDTELMKSYNQAAQLVGKTFAQQLPDAMQYLGKVAAATGQDMGYMVDSLVKGVGRMSPMILDNLGIQVSLTEANEAYAKSVGKSAEELSKSEQQTAMMNQVLEKLRNNTADMPDVVGSAATGFAGLGTTMANLRSQIGEALLPIASELVSKLSEFASNVGPKVVAAIRNAITYIQNLSPGAKTAALAIAGVTVAVLALSGAFAAFSVMLATTPRGLAIIGITAAAMGLVALADKIQKGVDATNQAVESMASTMARGGQSYDEYKAAVEASMAAQYKDQLARTAATAQALVSEAVYAGLAGAYNDVTTAQTGAALSAKMLRDEMLFEEQGVRGSSAAIAENVGLLAQWNDAQGMAAASAQAAAAQVAAAGELMQAAFSSDAMTQQLAANEQAFAAHGQTMLGLAQQNVDAIADAAFQNQLRMAQDEQRYQQEHTAMLAAGRVDDAAQLAAKFANEQGIASAQYATQQQLQQRNYLIQQIQAKRAYLVELATMRDQTLRVLQQQIAAEGAKRGMSQTAINQALQDIAKLGSDALQIETNSNIDRAQANTDFWKGTVTATGAGVKAIKDIIKGQLTTEQAAAQLDSQLKALEKQLLGNLPALPPLDTSAWSDSISDGAATAATGAAESATRTLASVVDDVESAVTSAKNAIEQLVDFDVPAGVDVGLGRLADFITIAVESFYATLTPLKARIEGIKDLLGPVDGLLSIVSGAGSVMAGISDKPIPNMQVWANKFADIIIVITDTLRWVRDRMTKEGLADAGGLVDVFGKLLSAVNAGVDTMAALADYAPVKNLAPKVRTLANDLAKVATAFRDVFVEWRGTTLLERDSLNWWADVSAMTANVKGGTDAMAALADYTPVKGLVGKVQVLASDMIKTATAFRDVFVEWLGVADLKQEALDWWKSVSAMVANVKGGTDAMSALADYTPVKGLVGKAQALASDMIKVATAFRDVFVHWLSVTNLPQEALDWQAKVSEMVANVKGGVDAMKALADYAPVKDLVTKARTLASDMIKVATALRDTFVAWVGATNLPQEALDWQAKVTTMIGNVKGGVDAMAALGNYTAGANVAATARALATDMIKAATAMRDVFVAWLGATNLSQTALDWWASVSTIVGYIKGGVDAMKALADYTPVANLAALVEKLSKQMGNAASILIVELNSLRDRWGIDVLKAAAETATAVKGVLDLLGVKLEVSMPKSNFAGLLLNFLDALDVAFPAIMERIESIRARWGGEVLEAAAEVAGSIKSVVELLGLGSLFKDLPEINMTKLDKFLGNLQDGLTRVADALVPYLIDLSNEWGDALNVAASVGESLANIIRTITDSVSATESALDAGGFDLAGIEILFRQWRYLVGLAGQMGSGMTPLNQPPDPRGLDRGGGIGEGGGPAVIGPSKPTTILLNILFNGETRGSYPLRMGQANSFNIDIGDLLVTA